MIKKVGGELQKCRIGLSFREYGVQNTGDRSLNENDPEDMYVEVNAWSYVCVCIKCLDVSLFVFF